MGSGWAWQAAEKAQKVAEAAIRMNQVERETAVLESQKEQEKARRVQKEAVLITLEAKRAAEVEKQAILAEAHAELEAAQQAREEAEQVAAAARASVEAEKVRVCVCGWMWVIFALL